MSRSSRGRPLPDLQPVRVEDPKTQRALDVLSASLRAIIQFLQPFVQPARWSALPPNSDWGRGSTANKLAQCRINALGDVELRGETKTVAATSTTLGVLPLGSRPFVGMSFPATVYKAGIVSGRIDIQTDGRVVLVEPTLAANIEVYLDGIRFSPEE